MYNGKQRLLAVALLLLMVFSTLPGFAEEEQSSGGTQVIYSDVIIPGIPKQNDAQDDGEGVVVALPANTEPPEVNTEPDEDGRFAVTFVAGGNTTVQHVDAGTLAERPAEDPAPEDGDSHFVGWFADGTGAAYDFFRPVTRNLTLTARFGTEYLVEFLNLRGYVVSSALVPAGHTVEPYDADALGIRADRQFIHWYEEGQDPEVPFDFDAGISSNLRLLPCVKDALLAIFVSEGTPVEPQRINPEQPVVEPKVEMIRPGYTFLHWSTEQDGAKAYPFTAKETDSVTLYAVWKRLPVKYTVVYWKEAAGIEGEPALPADYIYAFSREVTGDVLVGDTIQMDKAKAQRLISTSTTQADRLYIDTHFEYVTASDPVVALGDGSSIVNVYYRRIYHTVTFDFKTGATAYYLTDGVEHPLTTGATTYQMKAKLDQKLHDIWPYQVKLANPNLPFSLWQSYFSLSRDQFATFDEAGCYKVIKGFGMKMTASYSKAPDYVYRMYFLEMKEPPAELIDGKYEAFTYNGVTRYYEHHPEYGTSSQQNNTTVTGKSGYQNWPGRAIPGYRTANQTQNGDHMAPPIPILDEDGNQRLTSIGQKEYELHYYMDRLSYGVTLNAMGGTLAVNGKETYTEEFLYNTPISNDLLSMVPTKDDATFDGWYYDQGFKEKAKLDTIMPGYDVALFAKYTASGVDVTFYPTKDSDTSIATEETAPGGLVPYPADGYVVGQEYPGLGIFKGWAFDLDGISVLFSNSMPIYSDMEVYALWGSVPNTVTFYENTAGSETWKEIKIDISADTNTLAKNLTNPPASPPLPGKGYGFVGWYLNQEGTGARFTGATEILGDTFVYPVFAVPMVMDAQDVYANTNVTEVSGDMLYWAQMTAGTVRDKAHITADTGHANVRVSSTGVAFTDKTDYPPLKDPSDAYEVTASVQDNLGRVVTQTIQLHVSDTTDPVISGLSEAFFRVGTLSDAKPVATAAGLTASDDYADAAYLDSRLESDFSSSIQQNKIGTYQLTFTTHDTVDNAGSFPVAVTLWDEEVKAQPLTISVAQVATMTDDAYKTGMRATGYYYDGSANDGTAQVAVTGVDFSAVKPAVGKYWVDFATAENTTGGNWVTVIPDTYTVAASASHGTITPGGKVTVGLDKNLRLTYQADEGYMLSSVTVDGVTLKNLPSDYTFRKVRANHTIHAEFEPAPFTLTVRHYLLGTTTPVKPATTREVTFGASYSASADFSLAEYIPVAPTSVYGVMGLDAEVIFYYTSVRAYDVENPPEAVLEARDRLLPAVFIIHDDDIPLAGMTSRSIGDKAE